MASLYFKYGTMGSGKSLQLQVIAHNYMEQGKRVLLFKAAMDDRKGVEKIYSRVGLTMDAIPVYSHTVIYDVTHNDIMENGVLDAILVDEAQFLSRSQIQNLAYIVDILNIPVMAFGLKNDYRNQLFEGSRELLVMAENIEEIKTMCRECRSKATMVALFKDGIRKLDGEQIIVDNEENRKAYKYIPVCRFCYYKSNLHP